MLGWKTERRRENHSYRRPTNPSKERVLDKDSSKMDSFFGDLLQRAEQLTADMDTGSELPRIERNLPQLAEAGQRLWSKTATSLSEGADVKA